MKRFLKGCFEAGVHPAGNRPRPFSILRFPMAGSSNIVNKYDTTPWRYCHVCFSEALHLDCGGRFETKELRFTLCDQSFFQLSPIFASKRRMEGMHFLDGDKWSPSTNLFAIVRLTHARCQSVRLFNTTVARALDLAICTFFAALNGGLSTMGGNHGLGRGNSGKIEMVLVGLRRLRLLC